MILKKLSCKENRTSAAKAAVRNKALTARLNNNTSIFQLAYLEAVTWERLWLQFA